MPEQNGPERGDPELGVPEEGGPQQGRQGPGEPGQDEPQQLVLMRRMVDLAVERTRLAHERTRMSAERSEMSAGRSYMNAERTLSVWVRTALAVMVVGIAIDRFGLLLLQHPGHQEVAGPDTASAWTGAGLVALGVLMAAVTGVRFRRYAAAYRRTHTVPEHHGPFMAPAFALLVVLFGIVLLILLLVAP
jgi:putative membrane protein